MMEVGGEHIVEDGASGPQNEANQEGPRKSSRPRKQSKKALSLSQSSSSSSHESLQSPVKTVVKKRRQQWNACSLCAKFPPKKDRNGKKSGIAVNNGATNLKSPTEVLKNMCTKCARVIEREKKAKKPSKDDREKFEAEGMSFGEDLAKCLEDPEAKRLYCPFYQVHPCGCVQKYVSGELWKQKKAKQKIACDGTVDLEAPGEEADFKARGLFLLSLRKKSLTERREIVNARRMKAKAERDLTFPEEFTQFLLSRRLVLRRAGLCERGCQRVLGYSNNFLHKKVMNGPRLPPSKGKAVGVLTKLEDLPGRTCCYKKCVKMAEMNIHVLSTWRHQAAKSQKLSRQVIMEMFTPNDKKHVNCPTFVGMVTGSCMSTIMKIKTNMILSRDNKQALARDKGKGQPVSENSDNMFKARQPRTSTGAEREVASGSFVTHANVFHAKTSSPSHVSVPPSSNQVKTVAPPPSLDQLSAIKMLEDRHKKEMEELRRKQQEELAYFQQLQISQRKEQWHQQTVLEPAEFDKNLVLAQTRRDFGHTAVLLPLTASNKHSFIPLTDSKLPALTQPVNAADVNMVMVSDHSHISTPFSGTHIGTSQSSNVSEVVDRNQKPVTSKAQPLFLAKPSSQVSGTSFQQPFSLLPSTSLSPSSLGAHTVILLGSEAVASTSSLPAISSCKSLDKNTDASSSSTSSTFSNPELLGPFVLSDKMPSSSLMPQMTQSETTKALQTSEYLKVSESGENGNGFPTVNLLVGGKVVTQSAQNLPEHTIAYSQSHLSEGINPLSHSTQNVQIVDRPNQSAVLTKAPFQSLLNSQQGSGQLIERGNGAGAKSIFISSKDVSCTSSTTGSYATHDKTILGSKSVVLRGILPASDLQSVEGNTLTYSNVPLTRGTVVTCSSQKGQIGSNVSTLNAETRRLSLESTTVSQPTSVNSSSIPIIKGVTSDEQHPLSSKSYLLSDNRQIFILQGESQCRERPQIKSTASTISTSIFQPPQPSSSLTSYFSKIPFTSPLQEESRIPKGKVPSVSSQYCALVPTPSLQLGDSAGLKSEVHKKGQPSEKEKAISMNSSAHFSDEDSRHVVVKLGHQKNRTTRDKSLVVVGIVHPHITQSKSGPAQEEVASSQDATALTPPSSLGNGQNHIMPPASMQQSQEVAGQTGQINQQQERIAPSQSSENTSSVVSLESPVLSHPLYRSMDPSHRHQVPLHQQQTNLSQSIPLRPQGIALPQKLTLSEEQLQLLLGTPNQSQDQTLALQQGIAVPQEFPVGQQLQQSQPTQAASCLQTFHSLQPNTHQELNQNSVVGVSSQLSQHQPAGVQTEGYHILTGGQPMENLMVSSSSVLQNESNNLQDLQPTIQLLNVSTHNDVVTQVLMPFQSSLLNTSSLASGEAQKRTELREAPTQERNPSGINQLSVSNSSTPAQISRTDMPLIVSLSSTVNNSSRIEPTEKNPSQIILKENMEKHGSAQIQQISMTGDMSSLTKATSDGQTYQSSGMNNSAEANNLIRSFIPSYSNMQTGQPLNIKENILKTSNILESSKGNVQPSLVQYNALIPLTNANNLNATVSIDLEQNGPSSSVNSTFALLPCPAQQTFETASTSQIAMDAGAARNFSQQINDGKICIQMPSHEVPVIQHTLDQKKIVVLAGKNNYSFPMPMSSASGNQQIIINLPSQDSTRTTPFVSSLNPSSVVVPILDERNGIQLIHPELAPQIQDAETRYIMKAVESVQINQKPQTHAKVEAQNVQHIFSNVHHEELRAQNQVAHPVETSSPNDQCLNGHNFPVTNSSASQYPFLQTSKQLFSRVQDEQHHRCAQSNQTSCLGRKATSTGDSGEPVNAANKLGSVSKETKSPAKPKDEGLFILPDKQGFPKYKLTLLSPEPDNQRGVFSESFETGPGSSTMDTATLLPQVSASLPQNEAIVQLIAQSLMAQNLTLTSGAQIVLPFPAGIAGNPAPVTAKYEVTSRQENNSINTSQMTSRHHSMQEEIKTVNTSGKPFSIISGNFDQHQPNSAPFLSSPKDNLNKIAAKTGIQTGIGSLETFMIGQDYRKICDEHEPAGNSSTHIIGDTKIGSLVKTCYDGKISDSAPESMKAVMQMLKSSNASSLKINLPEVNEVPPGQSGTQSQTLTVLDNNGTSQQMLMGPVDGYKNHPSKLQEESVRLNVSFPEQFTESNHNVLSQAVASIKRKNISNLSSVRPDKNVELSDKFAHGSSERNAQHLSFLHDRELVIDITDENTKSSQEQEYEKSKDENTAFQVQMKASIENHAAVDTTTSNSHASLVLMNEKPVSVTKPERISAPPLVEGSQTFQCSASQMSSLASLLENPETCATLMRLLKNSSELQSQSSVGLSTDKTHLNDTNKTTLRAEHGRERLHSLSQINLNEVSHKGEMQGRRRTESIGTSGTDGSSKKSGTHSSYSTTSLPSSAVTFTRDTVTTDDSAGPPNVTLVSPTSLKRKQLQELENVAALSQNQDRQTEGLLIVTPSQFTNEGNQSDALQFSLSVSHPSALSQYGTLPVVDVSNSLVSSDDFRSKTNATNNTAIMSTSGKSNTLIARQILNTQSQKNIDTHDNNSLFLSSSLRNASRKSKPAVKRLTVKPRKHSKPPTIRDILSSKESSKTETLAGSLSLEMQYIVPASGNTSFVSSNTQCSQVLSTGKDKNASPHTRFAFPVEDERSHSDHSLPITPSRAKLMTESTNKYFPLQPEAQEKMHVVPESKEMSRGMATTQTEEGKMLRRPENTNVITYRVSSASKYNEFHKVSSTEKISHPVNPSLDEVNSKNSFNPDYDLKSFYELSSKDQRMQIGGFPRKVSSNGRLSTEVLSNEAVKAKTQIHQIGKSKALTSVTYSSGPISHHTSSLSSTTKTLNEVSHKNTVLSNLMSNPDHLSGCTGQQQCVTISKNPDDGVAKAAALMNKVEYDREPAVKLVQGDGPRRWVVFDEDEKMKSTPQVDNSEPVSSNIHPSFIRGDLGNQAQKLSFHLVNIPTSTASSNLDTGADVRSNPSSNRSASFFQRHIASSPATSSATHQSLSSQSLLVTTSHNMSQYGGTPHLNSQFRLDTLISSSLQNSTPLLSHMLQSSPVSLRSGAHQKDEKNVSTIWKDSRSDRADGLSSIQESSLEKDDQKYSVADVEPSVIPNNSFAACINDTDTETLSVNYTEIPKVSLSSDRITQVIDNMYNRHDEVRASSVADQPPARMLQAVATAQSCTNDKNQLISEQRYSTLEDHTRETMLKKRKSRKRAISENSGPDVGQDPLESVSYSDLPLKVKQSSDAFSLESKSGKRAKSKKEGNSRDRKKGTKSGSPGRCQPKRVQFSDIITNEDPHIETPTDKPSQSNTRGAAPVMSSSISALKDNMFSSSDLQQPLYAHEDSNGLFISSNVNVNEKEANVSTNISPSSHGMVIHQNISGEQSCAPVPQKDHYAIGLDLQQEPNYWHQQSSEDLSRRENVSDIIRHSHRPLSLSRRETEGLVDHSLKNDSKPTKMPRCATESLTISPSLNYSANYQMPEYSIAEGKDSVERGYQVPVPLVYSGEHESSFEIISARGYSKLAQQLKRQEPLTSICSTEHHNCLLPLTSTTQSSSKVTDYLDSPWQNSENADVDMSKSDNTTDSSVKRQKALQSDYKLAQQMALRPSQTRSRHPSQEMNDQSLDSGPSFIPQSSFTESSIQELYENSCMRSLYSVYQENVRLKHAVALATENHSRQRNLSAADKQKNAGCSSEIDILRRNSSMPSSPFEPDNIRKSPRAMILGKYGSSLSMQSSLARHSSSQESRSRNASGSYGLSQHYGESDVPLAKLMEVDAAGLGDIFHTNLNYNCFVPLSNQDDTLDNDPLPGQIDSLRLRSYQDSESDVHNRHRNLSSSSIKSSLIDSVIELEHGSRSRNPSASSLLRYFDHGNIRSRNPSGSSNRRSRPGSCSSDREFPEMDMLSLLRNSPFNPAWF